MSEAGAKAAPKRLCRCEARIAAAILDGYACGNAECWRTRAAEASFSTFVSKLVAARAEAGAAREGESSPRR